MGVDNSEDGDGSEVGGLGDRGKEMVTRQARPVLEQGSNGCSIGFFLDGPACFDCVATGVTSAGHAPRGIWHDTSLVGG